MTRRWISLAVIATVLAALWYATGTPWQPPVASAAAAVLARLITPTRFYWQARTATPRAAMIGLLVGGLVLLTGRSLWAWLLVGGTVVTVTVGWPAHRGLLLVTDGRTGTPVLTRAPRRTAVSSPLLHWRLQVALLALFVAIVGAVGVAKEYAAGERLRAQEGQSSAEERARMLPPSPGRAARALLQAVAVDDPLACTTLFDPVGAAQLAANLGAVDCPAAIHTLARRVVDRNRYPQPDSATIPATTTGDIATANACYMTWQGLSVFTGSTPPTAAGPQIGQLRLARVLGQGWAITGIQKC